MRLLTHNMLQCPRTKGYPLKLEVHEAKEVPVEYSKAFVMKMADRLDWSTFRAAAAPLTAVDIPVEAPTEDTDEGVWRGVHRALLEWHVVRGILRAPDGTQYEIKDGIPNLIITEAAQPTGAHDPAVVADVANLGEEKEDEE